MAGTNSKAQAQQNGNGKFVREVRSELKKRACELYDCRIYSSNFNFCYYWYR